ncbi:gliding motility lipoprotein GldH [Flavicella marina]|uniref:gliding motility lipoprotein GldH n=1 Tax=Flavicella marina TaxID=1475951 RepID=UPI001D034586|nr:gliding motility lipoprotein GldH [Flavicella marina]
MPIKMHKWLCMSLVMLSFIACDEYRIYDTYTPVGTAGWEKENLVHFEFDISDTLNKYDLFIQVRNTNEYEFSNLFLITEMQYPNGFHVVDTLEYQMADAYGNWLGKGFTDLKESKLFYKEAFRFKEKGQYEINIQQAMRKRNQLDGVAIVKGISDVGFRVEKQK